jgi:hypothetical protein
MASLKKTQGMYTILLFNNTILFLFVIYSERQKYEINSLEIKQIFFQKNL